MNINSNLLKEKVFKKYLLLIIMTCILSIFEMPYDTTYYNAIITTFFGLIFPNLLYLISVIYTFDLVSYYDKNYSIFLRLKNKKEYLDNLLNYCFKNLKKMFVLFALIFFVFASIYYFLNTSVKFDFLKIIIQLFYIIYNFLKVFVITELLIKIGIIIAKCFTKRISSVYLIIILILRYSWSYNFDKVDSFGKVHIFYGYFFKNIEYNTIFLDLFSFILQIIILLSFIELIKYLMIKYKKIYIEE